MTPLSDITPMAPLDDGDDVRPGPDKALGRGLFAMAVVAVLAGLLVLYFTVSGTSDDSFVQIADGFAEQAALWAAGLAGFSAAIVAACLANGYIEDGRREVSTEVSLGLSGVAYVVWLTLLFAFLG